MAYNKVLIFYLFVCNVDLISATIYSCDRTVDCGCSKYNANVYKIVGGEDSFPSSWGWAVSLQLPSGRHYCTGAIVSPLHIITAAHCVMNAEYMQSTSIIAGIDRLSESDSETAQVRSVSKVFAHPDYDSSTKVNDIAVIRLNESFAISSEMSTARLCVPRIEPSSREAGYPANATSLVAIGWGTLTYEAPSIPYGLHLQQVTVTAVPVDDPTCVEFVADPRFQFCAGVVGGGKDTCQGDSGGPLMRFESTQKRWLLAGVTSFGLGCGDPRYSGVYTRVSVYRNWLHSVINDTFIESLGDLDSSATENYYNICIALLSVVQLCFISL